MDATDFQTLNELFVKAAGRHGKPDAFLSKRQGRYENVSSAEALRRVAALGLALEGLGVLPGDRVALLSENREEWALSDYAVMGVGAIDVPLYPTLPQGEIEYILRDSGSRGAILSTGEQLQKVTAARDRLPELKFILVMDPAAETHPAAWSFEQVIQQQLARTPAPEDDFRSRALRAKPGDTATIIYTSGTTGQAKGVALTHANIVSNVKACMPRFRFTVGDRLLSFLPLSHIFERMIEYFAFWNGASIAYAESIETLPQNMIEVRPTIIAVVPRVLEKAYAKVVETVQQGPPSRQILFRWARRAGWDHASAKLENRPLALGVRVKHFVARALVGSKIRARFGGRVKYLISGSAPLSKEIARFFWAMGLAVYEGYGLTETSPVIAVNYPGHVKLGTVGPVLEGLEVALGEETIDAEGRTGKEVLVCGPSVFPGYYKLEEENQRAFSGQWFRTGDLGRLDTEGYLTITGRKKNLMKTSGGKYVSPEKIEGLFQGNPYVAQMMVLGDSKHFVAALIVPDFERLKAFANGQGINFQSREDLLRNPEVHRFMQQQVDEACRPLAHYEQIHQIALLPCEFSIESGELSPTQKVKRYVVEDRYRDLIDEIYRRPAPTARAAASPSR